MGQTKFFISHLEQRQGPFSLEEIQQKFNQNQLFPTDYIFVDVQNDWVMLFEFLQMQQKPADPSPSPGRPKSTTTLADLTVRHDHHHPHQPTHNNVHHANFQQNHYQQQQHHTVTPVADTQQLQFRNGENIFEIRADRLETLKLYVIDHNTGLKSKEPVEVEINSAPAEALSVQIPGESRAGEILKVTILAVDRWKNADQKYNGRIRIDINPPLKGSGDWEIKNGILEINFVPTSATQYSFRVESLEFPKLHGTPAHSVLIKPGKAASFIIEKPQHVRLGEVVAVKVKAVDAFGNIDHDYQGSAVLNLEKIPKIKTG